MNNYRKTSILIGTLFIVGTASGITGAILTSGHLNGPDYLVKVSANEVQIILGALFVWLMGFSLALVPLFLYPIFKKQNEVMAIGYVIFRGALETVTYLAIGVCMLLLLNLSQDYVKAEVLNSSTYQKMGRMLLKARELCSLCTIFVFGSGALMFYLFLFQSKLIPRWLSIWGLIAIALHLATGLLILFELQSETSVSNTIMNLPIFLQEMVMAVWLIAKGFNSNAINLISVKNE